MTAVAKSAQRAATGASPTVRSLSGHRCWDRRIALSEKETAAYAFKTVADSYVGRINFVRVFSGTLRSDVQLVNGAIAANVDAQLGTGSGRETSSWTIYVAGTTTPVDTLTLSANFTWIFLGLPSSDYHVFTGTIFPGYDDGTISIPADPTPFCSKCGWF